MKLHGRSQKCINLAKHKRSMLRNCCLPKVDPLILEENLLLYVTTFPFESSDCNCDCEITHLCICTQHWVWFWFGRLWSPHPRSKRRLSELNGLLHLQKLKIAGRTSSNSHSKKLNNHRKVLTIQRMICMKNRNHIAAEVAAEAVAETKRNTETKVGIEIERGREVGSGIPGKNPLNSVSNTKFVERNTRRFFNDLLSHELTIDNWRVKTLSDFVHWTEPTILFSLFSWWPHAMAMLSDDSFILEEIERSKPSDSVIKFRVLVSDFGSEDIRLWCSSSFERFLLLLTKKLLFFDILSVFWPFSWKKSS